MSRTTEALRRARTLLPVIALVVAFTGALACGDDDDDITGVVGAVTTYHDASFNFATLHTFAMPDTVIHFAPLTGTPLAVSREFDRTILDRVRGNLLARGYTQVSNPQTTTPNFVVLVGTTATENYNAYVSYSWFSYYGYYTGWGWYAPGFGTDWGIVYPWYADVGVTAYPRGSLLVTIVPTVTVNPLSKSITAAWVGAATALLGDQSAAVTSAVITGAIDEMFVQSPYLTASAPLTLRTPTELNGSR